MALRVPEVTQKLLVESGLVPLHCSKVELDMPASGPLVLRYEVFVTPEHLEKLAMVFQVLASEAKEGQDER
jgi:hypothetical protein